MQVLRLDPSTSLPGPGPAVSVGNFDGVHRGHQALIETAVSEARALGGPAVVLTFDPHPSRVLSPDRAPEALMTVEQKAEAVAAHGADRLVVLPFTHELSLATPEQFARDVLQRALSARAVVVGEGFRFGHRRAGDVAMLEQLGAGLGFRVRAVPALRHEGSAISSSRIREALARGDVEAAAALLGRPFFVDGEIVHGDGRGARLGFPTANFHLLNEMLPGGGVYACRVGLLPLEGGAVLLPGVANVGRRPTFGGGEARLEVHLLDFQGDLYGRRARLAFHERLREERAFPSPEALVAQVRQDVERARAVLAAS